MQPWHFALLFIAASLLVALAIDRHNYRSHRGLTRPAPVRLAQRPAPAQRLRPVVPPVPPIARARPAQEAPHHHRPAASDGTS